MSYVEVELVANAGVLVSYGEVNILIDGIHCEDGHPFCKVSPADFRLMKTGAPPFARLDYLLFTHEHPDHFTPAMVGEQLKHRPVKAVFMPARRCGSNELKNLYDLVREAGIEAQALGLNPGESKKYELDEGIALTVVGARHMGPQYQNVPNDCFMLSLGGVNLLFTGDADHVAEYYEKSLLSVELDAVFVNPIFYHNREGGKIIRDIFRPENVVVYHMPSDENDPLQLRLTVDRAMENYSGCGIQTHILQEKRQKLNFESSNL